jgi:hypothetical protein
MATSRISTSSILQGFPKSRSLLAGNPKFVPTSYESIATVTVGSGGQSSVDFNTIPTNFAHLQIRINCISASSDQNIFATFNGSSSNYASYHILRGDGSSSTSQTSTSVTSLWCGRSGGATNVAGGSIVDILDYNNTSRNKVTKALFGADNGGSGSIFFGSALWIDTSAITSISLFAGSGNINQYSSFALYGIKGV